MKAEFARVPVPEKVKQVTTDKIAIEVLSAIDSAGTLRPFSQRITGFDLASAYRVTAALHAKRFARGEKPLGRKIGFTNRTIWDEYKVFAPIWGYMYDTTLFDLARLGTVGLSKFAEPRLEPEIAFGFSRAPETGMNERQILDCIEWVSHGFEIVQSHFPEWKFAAPDTVANGGLHGAYFLGDKIAIANDHNAWFKALTDFEIDLFCNDKQIDRGHARNVLDGPLSAIKYFVELLAKDSDNAPLAAGEIVTTGTVTKAFAVTPGQRWHTVVHRLPVPAIAIAFAARP
jgi:2-oxo-3-hexenedioate decarboxylase